MLCFLSFRRRRRAVALVSVRTAGVEHRARGSTPAPLGRRGGTVSAARFLVRLSHAHPATRPPTPTTPPPHAPRPRVRPVGHRGAHSRVPGPRVARVRGDARALRLRPAQDGGDLLGGARAPRGAVPVGRPHGWARGSEGGGACGAGRGLAAALRARRPRPLPLGAVDACRARSGGVGWVANGAGEARGRAQGDAARARRRAPSPPARAAAAAARRPAPRPRPRRARRSPRAVGSPPAAPFGGGGAGGGVSAAAAARSRGSRQPHHRRRARFPPLP